MAIPKDLVEIILERTRERKLRWSKLSNTGFTSQIPPNSITIDFGGHSAYMLTITDERGTVLEQSDTETLDSQPLEEIYELARRQALRIDDALLHLKQKLEEL